MALYVVVIVTWLVLLSASIVNLVATLGAERYDRIPLAVLFVLLSVTTLAALLDPPEKNNQKN